MKRKVKLKSPFYILVLAIVPVLLVTAMLNVNQKEKQNEDQEKEVIVDSYPVINDNDKIINPYSNDSVKIGKSYYDYKAEEKNQEDSLIVHDDTYYQNTGIDFVSDEAFDVLSISGGTVISVKEDEAVGKTIEIKHDNGLISIYQILSEIAVKKNDVVSQGQVIGKSGNNELDKDLGNHVHLELYENGQSVNPELYLGKKYEKKN